MAWEQWILPAVLLGGVGGLSYLMAKKGIGCCGSMMSSGCGMGEQSREAPQPRAEARQPAGHSEVMPPAPVEPAPHRRVALVGKDNGNAGER